MKIERRTIPIDRLGALEVRAAEGETRTLAGHAAVFDVWTELWGMEERVRPGAFTRSLTEDDIRGLFNHNPDHVLGRNRAKTLTLREDKVGLAFEIELPNTQLARDLAVSIERGDITGCSFGFITRKSEWDESGEVPRRSILDAQLFDVGPVTYPAYEDTDVEARSLFEAIVKEERRKLEQTPSWRVAANARSRSLALTELD